MKIYFITDTKGTEYSFEIDGKSLIIVAEKQVEAGISTRQEKKLSVWEPHLNKSYSNWMVSQDLIGKESQQPQLLYKKYVSTLKECTKTEDTDCDWYSKAMWQHVHDFMLSTKFVAPINKPEPYSTEFQFSYCNSNADFYIVLSEDHENTPTISLKRKKDYNSVTELDLVPVGYSYRATIGYLDWIRGVYNRNKSDFRYKTLLDKFISDEWHDNLTKTAFTRALSTLNFVKQ